MNSKLLWLALLSSVVLGAGCSAGPGTGDQGVEENLGESDEALSFALLGEWNASNGGTILRIDFSRKAASTLGSGSSSRGYAFRATIDTGIRCITTPCPSAIDVSGVYRTSGKKLTLMSYDRPTQEFARILGDYTFRVRRGTLHLEKRDGALTEDLARGPGAYCVEYETTDGSGVSLRNMYAHNVSTYFEAKDVLDANTQGYLNDSIREGACNTARPCPLYWNPVCGEIATADPTHETYSNTCFFRGAIAQAAGAKGMAKGHYEMGQCQAAACTSNADCNGEFCGWDENNSRVCKPFAQEGENCGGFVLPAYRSECAPGLHCQCVEATCDLPGVCKR